MKKILFNPLGNSFALAGAWCGAFFAISLLFYKHPVQPGYYWSIYLWVLSVIFFAFFYPIKQLGTIRVIFSYYLINGIILLGASIWCYFTVPGIIPGFCYSASGVFYLLAFFRGEKRLTIEEIKSGKI